MMLIKSEVSFFFRSRRNRINSQQEERIGSLPLRREDKFHGVVNNSESNI